jgi:multidrug efflux pump subunit AcrB
MNKNFFLNIDSIKNDKNISSSITFQEKDIEKYEKEIQEFEKEIDKKHKDEISLIVKIREIKENEKNHKDNIICNDLKEEKEEEYKKKTEKLFNSLKLNMKDGKKKREEILENINKIESAKEEIIRLKYTRTQSIFKELEKARNEILIGFGNYIYDNEKNKKLIDILNEKNNFN